MKIRIKDDAAAVYRRSVPRFQAINWEWVEKMQAIQGLTLDVETEFLFHDQYNTAPVPGVSEQGFRLMDNVVAEVIDDERPNRRVCGKCSTETRKEYYEATKNRCRNCWGVDT